MALLLMMGCASVAMPALSSSAAASALPSDQVASQASSDAAKCPLRAADLDKLTPYRWQFGQYKADRGFIRMGASASTSAS
jgi:hypothetical protein